MLKLSVVIPTYKRDCLLGRAIKSLECSFPVEAIIIDDHEYNPRKLQEIYFPDNVIVKYLPNSHLSGPNGAQLTGIKLCSGSYFTTLNDDDYLIPGSLDYISSIIKFYDNYSHFQFNSVDETYKLPHVSIGQDLPEEALVKKYINSKLRGNLFGIFGIEHKTELMSLNEYGWGGEGHHLAKIWEKAPPKLINAPIRVYATETESMSDEYFSKPERSFHNEIDWLEMWSTDRRAIGIMRAKKIIKAALYLSQCSPTDKSNILENKFKFRRLIRCLSFLLRCLPNITVNRLIKLQIKKY